MQKSFFLFVVLCVALQGCQQLDVAKAGLLCATAGDSPLCPDGLTCVDGCCVRCAAQGQCDPGYCGSLPDASTPPDLTPTCVASLSEVGKADFTISFRISTRATVASTILYQRFSCDATRDLWDVQLTPQGTIRVAVIEVGGVYTDLITTASVNNGAAHDVVLSRSGSMLRSTVDGLPAGSAAAPQKLGTLPPLGMLSGGPCEAAGIKPLVGTVTNVCLLRP